jgi:hypothetical protein
MRDVGDRFGVATVAVGNQLDEVDVATSAVLRASNKPATAPRLSPGWECSKAVWLEVLEIERNRQAGSLAQVGRPILSGEWEAGSKFHRHSSGLGKQRERWMKPKSGWTEPGKRRRFWAAPLTSALNAR